MTKLNTRLKSQYTVILQHKCTGILTFEEEYLHMVRRRILTYGEEEDTYIW